MDDLISRKWLVECIEEGWIKFDTEKDANIYIHLVRDIAPSAQPEQPCTAEVGTEPTNIVKNCNDKSSGSDDYSYKSAGVGTDCISRQAAIDALDVLCQEHRYKISEKAETYSQYNEAWQDALDRAEGAIGNLPSAQPKPCEDAVPRTSVEYICRKNTVSTNPYEHKYHDKFIQFMDDPEISDFGRWQHSNGFNTALVAVKCDLDKVPSAQPMRKKGKWEMHTYMPHHHYCSICGKDSPYNKRWRFCPNCGADMRCDDGL